MFSNIKIILNHPEHIDIVEEVFDRFKDPKRKFFLRTRGRCCHESDNRCRHLSSHAQDCSDINDTLRSNVSCHVRRRYNVVTIKSPYDRRTSVTEDS